MSKNRELKVQVVADIVEKLKACKSLVVCSYSGLTVEQVTNLRKLCRDKNVQYCVLKNRLVLRALQELNIAGLENLLEGPNAFVFSMGDVTDAPKVVNDFIEKNKLQSLKITGGILEGKAFDVNTVKALANLPSREVLLAKLLGCMSNTVASFVRVIDAYRKKLAGEE
jgi:large subunit ribosomal protein L10